MVTRSVPTEREVEPCCQMAFKSRKGEMDELLSYPDCDLDNLSRIEFDMGGQPRLNDPLVLA